MATQRHLINSDKGAINGVASLDAAAKVPLAQLDTGANGLTVKVSGKVAIADLPTGTASGQIPVLSAGGKLDIALLPNGLEEMEFYNTLAAFPVTGAVDIVYVARDTNKSYLWSGTVYVEMTGSSANPTTNITMPNSTTGLILISPNNTKYKLLVDDDGALTTTSI